MQTYTAFWKQSCDYPHENGHYCTLLTSFLIAEFRLVVDILGVIMATKAHIYYC